MTTGLYWFTQDLRLDDNPALTHAANETDRLLCVYVHDPRLEQPNSLNSTRLGPRRRRFLDQALTDLDRQLQGLGHRLWLLGGDPVERLTALISMTGVRRLYLTRPVGCYEQAQLDTLASRFPQLELSLHDGYTLYEQAQLADLQHSLPQSFSQFRRAVEPLTLHTPLLAPRQLPPALACPTPLSAQTPFARPLLNEQGSKQQDWFRGGEYAAQLHLEHYFSTPLPLHYKEVRNELDGLENGTRLSPWLAQGSLSPRRVVQRLRAYEQLEGANDSTYWIFFELLWREFFQWYARHHRHRLFRLQGIQSRPTLTSFYPQRFKSWCEGSTPWPLVNACMHQLKQTGWISNRGRQIVASCLVNELQLDWRYGAACFEQELIDYDVASNWGNWQYLAGVGADPRGKRHFNIEKQTQQYDPEGVFIDRWQGRARMLAADTVDAADWPILPQ